MERCDYGEVGLWRGVIMERCDYGEVGLLERWGFSRGVVLER